MKCPVITLENKKAGEVELADDIFGLPARADILARMVNWQLARARAGTHKTKGRSEVSGTTAKPWRQKGTGRARAGTHKTKGRSEVSGTTAKPWRQKGTGRARAGTLRAAQFRGGGAVFGPTLRDHSHGLPKKVRRLALKTALSAKQAEGKLIVLDKAALKDGKTKSLAGALEKMGVAQALVIDGPEIDVNFARAAANIVGIDVLPQQGANVYDILRRDTLILTKDAVSHLEARLK